MTTPARLLRSLSAAFAGNERLQWGVWAACCLFFIHVIILQSDRLASIRQDYATGLDHLQKAEALLTQQGMPDLLDAERNIHGTLRAMLWRAETEGLSAAKLRAALSTLLGDLGIRNIHFRSASSQPLPELPGAWRTELRLDANYRRGMEPRILHALASQQKRLFVDRLDLKHLHENKASLVLVVSAYFVKPGGEQN